MPRPAHTTLIWSELHQLYELYTHERPEQRFSPGDEHAFFRWLEVHNAFAFIGQAGRLSVLKEARERGSGYWYAYRKQGRQTRKRYLGPTQRLTFTRLEQMAKELSDSSSSLPSIRTRAEQPARQRATLLSSKLSPPRLSISLVERPRLLSELDAARSHPLTLVSASAGSGKTTLLSAWVAVSLRPQKNLETLGSAERTAEEFAVAWLSLDELDNDPIRFWASVMEALCTGLPNLGQRACEMLYSSESPPLSTILTTLLQDLLEEDSEIILILDDYHVISDQAIFDSMRFLLNHIPANLHLVLATRTDPELPLSRLRVRGQLIEVRDRDLRFTQKEAAGFLTEGMGLPLSEGDVATLHQRTEGWIAGLQLAALSMRKRDDLSAWVSDFAGSYRFLLDYVQQEILAQLPGALQDFLLQTSILTRMNAALCQAVTARPSREESQEMLETLERGNLFVVPLDEHRQWYRYHDLFREALLARLHASQPGLVTLLHQRAARWYEATGELREAITHALAALDYSYAASLMEQAAPHFWLNGEARTVQNWVLSLPDPVMQAHLRLALNAALRFHNSVHFSTETVHASMAAQVERTVARVEAILRTRQPSLLSAAEVALIKRRLRLLRALIESRALFRRGDKERLRLLTQELEALPSDEEVSWRMIPLTFTFWMTLAYQQASALLVPRLREARQWIGEAGDPLVTFRVMTWLARAYIHAGQLHLAHQECLEALVLLKQIGGGAAIAGYLLSSLFDILYAWNRLEEAPDALQRLLHTAHDWQQVELRVIGESAVAHLALARGDLDTAQEAQHRAEMLFGQEEFVNNVRWVVEIRVQIWLAQGNLAEAQEWAAQTALSLEVWDPLHKWVVLLLVRVFLAQQQYARAVETLERFREHLDHPADTEKALEWMALYVVALYHAGKSAQIAPIAARLLALTEPEGYIRLYLDAGEPMRQALKALLEVSGKEAPDTTQEKKNSASSVSISRSYVSHLLAAFEQEEQQPARISEASSSATTRIILPPTPQEADLKTPIEPLSRQEQRVLRLLVAGQTYAEMARTLIVSPNTIKTQISSIYRKLGVSRRAEAIALTRRLQIL